MADWLWSMAWYVAIATALLAALAIVRPLPRLRLRTRARALVHFAIAAIVIMVVGSVTPHTQEIASPVTAHDLVQPRFQFREVHVRDVAADSARVMRAVAEVTANEIALFRTFTAIRRFGRPGPESILNAPSDRPILDVATQTSFVELARSDHEVVIGSVLAAPPGVTLDRADAGGFARLSGPGLITASLSFRVTTTGASSSRLITETRVYASDQSVLRRFTRYWRTIFPGSWILRVTWLQAIAARAAGA
jgi:hypothetical protein